MNVPDYPLEETIDFKFTSRAFATGIPTTLAGTPAVEIYEDNSVTQITAAETLTVDFDSVTGLNNLRVVATAANGFESGKSYQAVISAGTVGGVSVVGEVVAQFSIERSPALRPTTAGRTLDVTATGAAGIDWANVENPTTAVDLSATDIQLCDTVTTLTDHTAQTGDTYALANGATGFAAIDTVVDAILVDTGTTLPARFTGIEGATFATGTDSLEAIRDRGDAAWTTGGGSGLTALATGTCQAGSTSTTAVLAAAHGFANDELNGTVMNIHTGTGAGQSRVITDYVGATDTATVTPAWTTTPDNTSQYEVVNGSVNLTAINSAAASGSSTIDANVVQVSGDSTAADNMESAFDGTGYGFTSCTMPTTTTLTNWHASVTDWTDGGRLDLILDAILDDTDLIDDATSGLAKIATDVAAVLVDTGTTIPGTITTMQGNVTDILADTNELQTDDIPTTLATLATAAALSTHDGKLDTLDTLVDRMAPLLVGTVTGAGTGTEVYVYGGVTATVTVDASGNVSGVVFS